ERIVRRVRRQRPHQADELGLASSDTGQLQGHLLNRSAPAGTDYWILVATQYFAQMGGCSGSHGTEGNAMGEVAILGFAHPQGRRADAEVESEVGLQRLLQRQQPDIALIDRDADETRLAGVSQHLVDACTRDAKSLGRCLLIEAGDVIEPRRL